MYEVHDYIKSYLGESKDAHDFAKQFLEKRQKLKPPSNQVSKLGGLWGCGLSLHSRASPSPSPPSIHGGGDSPLHAMGAGTPSPKALRGWGLFT